MQKIPATSIALTGQHLIEASAGTGKTWTLTGIVLRLLIEAKRPPEQIICTTFTRDATAEMRERILARLHDFYQLLLWLEKISQDNATHAWLYSDETDEKKQAKFSKKREQQLTKLAENMGYQETFSDPINLYLINYLLDNYQDYPLSMAIRRTQLLQISMDKLFVGTLDSLAQKWLSEYSAETGYQQGMAISDIEDEMITDIIHDEIRQYHARLYHQQPILYQLLQQSNKLTDIDNHKKSVQKAMQFISAPVDEVQGFDFTAYHRLIQQLITQDISDVQPYFDEAYRKKQGMRGGTILFKSLPLLEVIFQAITEHQEFYFLHLDENCKKLLDTLEKVILDPEEKGFGFNKNRDKEREQFIYLDSIQNLYKLHILTNSLDDESNRLNYQIIQAVRKRLPLQLEENNQTTFSLQMVRLNQALTGRQGQTLARYIRHHYPIALIDESQDINGEQAKMLSSIYINKNKDKSEKNGFLLLVGDPKQAIYGFRGGDVANYNMMKINFKNPLSLTVNRRSNARLINGLNQWFGANETNSENDFAKLGEGIYYQHIQAHNENSKLSWQTQEEDNLYLGKTGVGIVHIPVEDKNSDDESYDKYQIVAKHIQAILQSNETLENKAITASDIAILARSKKDLQHSQWALEKLNIPTVKTAEISIFSSQMATDLLAILQAIENPFHTGYVNRALTTHWYGLSLQQVKALANGDNFSYYDFQRHLQMAQQQWEDWGVMSAVQFLLKENPFAENKQSVWEHLAEYSLAERFLLDLRQLLDLLAQHSRGKGVMEILDWLTAQVSKQPTDEDNLQHAIPTEAGVQLMTIHKSKGLEFPIVYVLGMDNTVKKNETTPYIFPYLRSNERRLSVVKDDKNKDYQLLVNNESLEEEKRIYYVALTRASEQVFVVMQDHAKNATLDYRPSILWLECDNKEKKYNLPNRLQNKVDWITSEQILQVVEGLEQQPIKQPQQAEETESRGLIGYKNYYKVIKERYFRGWRKTSFTALSYQLDKHSEDMAIAEPDYMFDEGDFTDNYLNKQTQNSDNLLSADDIRFNFVGGAVAGTFLHKILEKINFDNPQHWSEKIDKGIREYGLPVSYASSRYQGLPTDDNLEDNPQHQALKNWLSDILQSPLQSSKVKLSELQANQRKAELGFDLGLGDDFKIEKINEVFTKYLDIEGADKDKLLRLSENRSPHYYRYLRGEIDLVYQHKGKYYVVDYKSNYLGDSLNNYNQIGLRKAMSHAGYWLQAVIYQVALHRLLKLRVADYEGNEEQYLGAVEYVFLRGCLADDSEYGKISWDIPIELVKEMDRVFG
ncbi:MAG: UvrD-helicase domain-containing protein [Moraxellaceae bacterium]|nr:UvrD-helicase domain-containing protein [Moraxellaceae bacterium]